MKSSSKFKFGPGLIVTAAFIGPGTVTTCTLAGTGYGYSLLWAIVFAVFATFILHEMSCRVGLVGKLGLGEALYRELPGRTMKIFGMVMVVIAIGVGNAALQKGNILGASLGFATLTDIPENVWPFIVGACAFCLLWFGSYKIIEKIFICFVALMSLCFIVTAAFIRPDLSSIVTGIFILRLNDSNFYIALGLIGTTIVPYNFFIYATIIQKKWKGVEDMGAARFDFVLALIIGGMISMAIIVTSSAAFYGTGTAITNGADMALQLEPLLGTWAKAAIALGLFGAGMSSATAAPLGAAIALTRVFQWGQEESDNRFRVVWCSVLATGVIFASIGLRPVSAIIFAQAVNAVFVPIVALFLLYIVNKKGFLGEHVNTVKGNVVAGLILVITIILASRGVLGMQEYFRFLN